MSEQDWARADSLQQRLSGEEDSLQWRLVRAYAEHNVPEQERILAKESNARRGSSYLPLLLAGYAGEVDGAERAELIPFNEKAGGEARRNRQVAFAAVDAWRGRYASAWNHLAAADAYRPAINEKVEIAAQPFATLSQEQLLRLHDEILRSDSTAEPSGSPDAQLRPQIRLFQLAVVNCKLGRAAEALVLAQQMEMLRTPAYWVDAMRALATDVRAIVDADRGDANSALRRLESLPEGVPMDLLRTGANREIEMAWRAELLYRVGRYDDALRWFETLPYASNGMVPGLPFFFLRRAEIQERKGNVKAAEALYAQFIKYMGPGDPQVQPLVTYARQRLADLQRKID